MFDQASIHQFINRVHTWFEKSKMKRNEEEIHDL